MGKNKIFSDLRWEFLPWRSAIFYLLEQFFLYSISHVWHHKAWYLNWPQVCSLCLRHRNKSPNKSGSLQKSYIILSHNVALSLRKHFFGDHEKHKSLHKWKFIWFWNKWWFCLFCNRLIFSTCIVEFPVLRQSSSGNVNSLETSAHTLCDPVEFPASYHLF